MEPRYVVLLVISYFCYLLMGAFVFHILEHNHEEKRCQEVLKELGEYNISRSSTNDNASLRDLVELILQSSNSGVQFDSDLNASCAHNWNYHNSFFFAGTVITTIGYGNIAPTTWKGRVFCIFFAIVGLPLFGIMFTEIGALFGGFFKHFEYRLRRKILSPRLRHCCILLALLTTQTIFFLIIPSFIFVIVEGWEYQEAFYYSFITLTTIGFGDYVAGNNPDHTYNSLYRIGVYFWVLFGLAFMAAVVNVMSDVIQGKAKEKLKGDPNRGDDDKPMELGAVIHNID